MGRSVVRQPLAARAAAVLGVAAPPVLVSEPEKSLRTVNSSTSVLEAGPTAAGQESEESKGEPALDEAMASQNVEDDGNGSVTADEHVTTVFTASTAGTGAGAVDATADATADAGAGVATDAADAADAADAGAGVAADAGADADATVDAGADVGADAGANAAIDACVDERAAGDADAGAGAAAEAGADSDAAVDADAAVDTADASDAGAAMDAGSTEGGIGNGNGSDRVDSDTPEASRAASSDNFNDASSERDDNVNAGVEEADGSAHAAASQASTSTAVEAGETTPGACTQAGAVCASTDVDEPVAVPNVSQPDSVLEDAAVSKANDGGEAAGGANDESAVPHATAPTQAPAVDAASAGVGVPTSSANHVPAAVAELSSMQAPNEDARTSGDAPAAGQEAGSPGAVTEEEKRAPQHQQQSEAEPVSTVASDPAQATSPETHAANAEQRASTNNGVGAADKGESQHGSLLDAAVAPVIVTSSTAVEATPTPSQQSPSKQEESQVDTAKIASDDAADRDDAAEELEHNEFYQRARTLTWDQAVGMLTTVWKVTKIPNKKSAKPAVKHLWLDDSGGDDHLSWSLMYASWPLVSVWCLGQHAPSYGVLYPQVLQESQQVRCHRHQSSKCEERRHRQGFRCLPSSQEGSVHETPALHDHRHTRTDVRLQVRARTRLY